MNDFPVKLTEIKVDAVRPSAAVEQKPQPPQEPVPKPIAAPATVWAGYYVSSHGGSVFLEPKI